MALALFLGWGALVYSNSWDVPFQFDDEPQILLNHSVRDLSDIKAVWSFARPRFLPFLSFAFNNTISYHQAFGFHLFNFIVHVFNTFWVYLLTQLLLSAPKMRGVYSGKVSSYLSFLTALIFLSHPLQTGAVTYLVQRSTLLGTFFYLGAMVFYFKGRSDEKKACYYLAFVMALLAMFSKEIAFTLPFAIVLTEILFCGLGGDWKKTFSRWLPFLLLCAIVPYLHISNPPDKNLLWFMPSTVDRGSIPPVSYLLTQLNVISTYLRLFFLPIHQNLDYDYSISHSFLAPETLGCFLFLSGLLIAGIWLVKKNRLAALAIFWFFLTLSVESSFVPLRDVIFEHRMYLPLAGCAIFLTVTLFYFIKRTSVAMAAGLLIVFVFSSIAYARNQVWKTEVSLWEDVVRKSPHKSRGYLYLANAFLKERRSQKARECLEKVLRIDPLNVKAYHNLGVIYRMEGDPDRAIANYKRSIEINPGSVASLNNLALVYIENNQLDLAMETLRKALEVNPDFASAYFSLGLLYEKKGDLKGQMESFTKAMMLDPYLAPAHFKLGLIFNNGGELEKAAQFFRKSCALDPNYVSPVLALGFVYFSENKMDLALKQVEKLKAMGQEQKAGHLRQMIREKISKSFELGKIN